MPRAHLWAYLLTLSALWGAAFPLLRFAVQSMPPFALSAARAGVAAVALGVFVIVTRQAVLLDRTTLRIMLVLGLLNGLLPNVLSAAALGRITSAQGALIQCCGPLIVGALASLLLREEGLSPRRLAGMALGVAGVAVIFAPLAASGGGSVLGGLLMLGTTSCYAYCTIYVRWVRPASSVFVTFGQQIASMLPALALSLALDPPGSFDQPARIWAVVLLLGIFASAIPFTLYLRMLRTAPASDAAMIGYLQPVWATALGAALLGEWPEPRVLLGGAVVLGGVWIASGRRAPASARPAQHL